VVCAPLSLVDRQSGAVVTASVAVFTSIAANYLPKARVLATSLKRVAPHADFYLMLVDAYPEDADWSSEPFDALITVDDLAITNATGWCFAHQVVELCTAVKGFATGYLLDQPSVEQVFYFDPDMVVHDRFGDLEAWLSDTSILLTPHQTEPETGTEAIMDNEMASLKHGVFNMGFFGVRDTAEGRRFAQWWSKRLEQFCLDDIPRGLFTDQKWANLVPCFFEDYRVIRSPAFNVATWNITTRKVEGSLADGVTVNGEPLGFYHFSGFDSGDQALMLNKYGSDSQTLNEMRAWYIKESSALGQEHDGQRTYGYAHYADGELITAAQRTLYRQRIDLQRAFPDPFLRHPNGGYLDWYRANAGDDEVELEAAISQGPRPVDTILESAAHELQRLQRLKPHRLKRFILQSISWMLQTLSRLSRMLS